MSNKFVSPAEVGALPATYSFERVGRRTRRTTMEWSGTSAEVIRNLNSAVAKGAEPSGRTPLRFIGLGRLVEPPSSSSFWEPGRLMRAIIDSPVIGQTRIGLVNEASRFALRFYADGTGQEQLQNLQDSMSDDLRWEPIAQRFDNTTLSSTKAGKTEAAAKRLLSKTTDDVFMVPICHGGFVAGIQMALQYQRLNPEGNMSFYPIRFSREKKGDVDPHLSNTEMDYIKEGAEGRTIVVFDEDAYSGHSVGRAVQKFQGEFPDQEVLGLVGHDARYFMDAEKQGLWWEQYSQAYS